jgi:hypothetical protein
MQEQASNSFLMWGKSGAKKIAFILVLAILWLVILPYAALLNTFPWLVSKPPR